MPVAQPGSAAPEVLDHFVMIAFSEFFQTFVVRGGYLSVDCCIFLEALPVAHLLPLPAIVSAFTRDRMRQDILPST